MTPFALCGTVDYDSFSMTNVALSQCDGCGQVSSPEHVAERLKRLEWATRFRPIHIGVLFLGAASPIEDREFLYAGREQAQGEAKALLRATVLSSEGKPAEVVLGEFQRLGFFLAHVLECPQEPGENGRMVLERMLAERLPFALARIRRSLKPKRIALISSLVDPFVARFESSDIECPLILDNGKSFALDGENAEEVTLRLRDTLASTATLTR